MTFRVCKLCSDRTNSVSFYPSTTSETWTMWITFLTFSAILNFYSSGHLKIKVKYIHVVCKLKFFNFKQGRMIPYMVAFYKVE